MTNQFANIQWMRTREDDGFWIKVNQQWMISVVFKDVAAPNLDNQLDEIGRWCQKAKCGRRMAYDMFQFKSEAEITMFLLRWS
jgi:hypothetical protein